MRDYSLSEIEDMQEKALQRVESMRELSKNMTGMSSKSTPTKEEKSRWSQTKEKEKPAQEKHQTGRISMPLNLPKERDLVYPSFKESFAILNTAEQEQKNLKQKAGFLDTVFQDADESLLFCLLLLFKSEEHNEPIMLALLYILWA